MRRRRIKIQNERRQSKKGKKEYKRRKLESGITLMSEKWDQESQKE